MSLYHEAADVLTAPTNTGGSLKSRIFGKKDLKSQPAQIYALAVETCKWSSVLKEVIENADLLHLERKLTPVLALLLAHDLLLAKKGIALPVTHGLRTTLERHKARLQAELTKARLRRKLGSLEELTSHVEEGLEDGDRSEAPYPRWVRINTLKTTLEDQLDTTFTGLERAATINDVRRRGSKRIYIDDHVPYLVAVSPGVNLSKCEGYRSGAIIFQDKASCFPAYLLDPLAEDGDIIDTCAAPGNKTTHVAAILLDHASHPDECSQTIHAFEKDKNRAQTLEKMVALAGSGPWTKVHAAQDFLKTNPEEPTYRNVKALLLDPSCSGSGIVGRDEVPELHLPLLQQPVAPSKKSRKGTTVPVVSQETRKRKREEQKTPNDVMVDDDGLVTALNSEGELKARLSALSAFQLELLQHAFKFPAARKVTYSTCSIHPEENELVVEKALDLNIARARGWRILKRDEQVRGMREWPVRGFAEACGSAETAEACIRANKGDEHGTMGFFLAGFIRDEKACDMDDMFLRDERGHLVRDLVGFPMRKGAPEVHAEVNGDEDEWNGFGDNDETDTQPMEVEANTLPLEAAETTGGTIANGEFKDELSVRKKQRRKKKGYIGKEK